MATKNQRRADRKKAPKGAELRREAERLIEKGRLKDAVKQAKLCFREESDEANRRLLERAYLLRAQQLLQEGMPVSAQEVAQHLLDFGVTDPGLVEGFAALLLALGREREALALQGRLDTPEAKDRLLRQAADLAVLHPERAPASLPEVRQGARRVRAALEALEAGDEAKALDELRDIARNSPLADWRLFVRGLAAFYRRAAEEAQANWERLEPGRAAARIAQALRSQGTPKGQATADLSALETRTFGAPVLAPLRQLRACIAQERWTEAVRLLGSLRPKLQGVDPKLAVRLTRILYEPLIKHATKLGYREAMGLIQSFTRQAEPLPIDPHWNRLWALAWDGPQGEFASAEPYWRKYLEDLKTLPALEPEERTLAQALVWKHLGMRHLDEADALGQEMFGMPAEERQAKTARRRAVECLEESLRLYPSNRETYQELIDAYVEWDQPEQAAAVARRLLAAFPDDFDALMFLSTHHFRRDEPAQSLEYALRARKIKPLDESAAHEEWAARVGLARHLALQGRWDEGRAEFEAAARAWPEQSQHFHFLARKAVFELKAGQADRAEQIIREAQKQLVEPTPLWLALRIEASRYKLPKADVDRFEESWTKAITKRCRSETAGALADLLATFLGSHVEYPGRAQHVKFVVDYLRRTTRIKYRHDDLAHACTFLGLASKDKTLLEKLVQRGLKLFPDSPVFLMLAGSLELEKGPLQGGNLPRARAQFEKALERAQASSNPRDTALVPKIKESLSLLTTLTSGPMGMLPFGGFGGGGPPGPLPFMMDLFDELYDDFDDEFDDDEDDDEFEEIPTPTRTGPRRTARKRKKRR